MRGLTDRLVAFNNKFGRPVRQRPTVDLEGIEVEQLLGKLDEEVTELREAIDGRDLKAIADGLADTIYVTAGIALQFGIDIDVILDLVHKSNMTKTSAVGGEPVKGDAYREPPIAEALESMTVRAR